MTRLAAIIFVSFLLSAPLVALGQSQTIGPSGNTTNTTGQTIGSSGNTNSVGLYNPLSSGSSLESFVLNLLDLITNVIGPIIVVFMVVYVGFLYVTARGNESKISAAHDAFLWTVVGALILLGAKAIALAIEATVQGLSGS
ncbi:MAG TPA: TrbC/VirB2 family protein [Candidatus Paceibacterota bacterium]|nr:TrbC/VirB2 family protein [Candidatus Paceibacterota bacterium]